MKYVKSEENVCDYSSRHIYKDLLKFKEIIHYVNFVAHDATLNWPYTLSRNSPKNDKFSHQVIKLVRQNDCYKLNEPLTLIENIENRNNFKHYLKTDSELTIDDDLVLKSNRIVIPSDLQNHFIPLAH